MNLIKPLCKFENIEQKVKEIINTSNWNLLIQKFKKGTYLLLVNKHALTVKNGVMIDNGNYQYGGYRRVVESAFQVK